MNEPCVTVLKLCLLWDSNGSKGARKNAKYRRFTAIGSAFVLIVAKSIKLRKKSECELKQQKGWKEEKKGDWFDFISKMD